MDVAAIILQFAAVLLWVQCTQILGEDGFAPRLTYVRVRFMHTQTHKAHTQHKEHTRHTPLPKKTCARLSPLQYGALVRSFVRSLSVR